MLRPILLAGTFAALAFPASSLAAAKDSDHDGMPNKWEQRFHLNAHKNDAAKDKDKDGLANLAEYQSNTNPRKADSDGDGKPDAQEDADGDGVENEVEEHTGMNPGRRDSDGDGVTDSHESAGSIVSFDGTTLVISRVDGSQLTGTVTAETEIEGCSASPPAPATAARLGHDDGESEDAPRTTTPSTDPTATQHSSESGDSGSSDGESGDHGKCTTAALVAGAPVHEAELEQGVFHSVHLQD